MDLIIKTIYPKNGYNRKINFWCGLLIVLFCIIFLIATYHRVIQDQQPTKMIAYILIAIIVCLGACSVLINYSFLRRNDSIDTPDQLLYWYNKKIRYDVNISTVYKLLFVGFLILQGIPYNRDDVLTLIFIIALCLFLVYLGRGSSLVLSRDQLILEKLHDLTKKE